MTQPTIERTPSWHETPNGSTFYWRYQPQKTIGRVLLLSPLGHEAFHSHRFFCRLAEALCETGYEVIRFDWLGTQDSSGELYTDNLHQFWLESAASLMQAFESTGPLNLIGLRLGANLAQQLAETAEVHQVIALAPVLSGKRLVRELKATASVANSMLTEGGLEAGGHRYSETLLDWLNAQTFNAEPSVATHCLLETDKAVKKLSASANEHCQVRAMVGYDGIMAEPQYTEISPALMASIFEVLGSHIGQPNLEIVTHEPVFKLIDASYQESVFADALGQVALETRPNQANQNQVLVLMNSGSGPHTGPNRLYVRVARQLASAGITTIRFDLANLGDSATAASPQENHCYTNQAARYTTAMLKAVRQRHPSATITAAGICSGAHHAFHHGLFGKSFADQLLVINPLTFYWHEGMSLAIPEDQKTTVDANYYAQTLKDPKAWLKLLKGKANLPYIAQFCWQFVRKQFKARAKAIQRLWQPVPDTDFNRDLATHQSRNVKVHFMVAEQDPGWGLIADASQLSWAALQKHRQVTGETIPKANHTFSRWHSQEQLIQRLQAWLLRDQNEKHSEVALTAKEAA